jgi:integrase
MNVVFLDPETAVRELVPTPMEYAALVEEARRAAPAYIADLLTAAWETGLRKGEILNWDWKDMDMTFLQGLPAYTVWISKQKKKRPRQVPMTHELYDMLLERWCAAGRPAKGWVWPVLTPPNRIMRRVFKKAGCKHLCIHDFRKAYKTMRKAEGWTTEQTMAVQGHATDSMDNYYTIFQRKHLEPLFEAGWKKSVDNGRKFHIITGTEG